MLFLAHGLSLQSDYDEGQMNRQELDGLLRQIRTLREEALVAQNDLTEADFVLSTASFRQWRWDTARLVLLQMGNHMREHATHIRGTRAALGRELTQPQRMLAEAEMAWGNLLAAVVGLTDEDLDAKLSDDDWTIRRILEHIRNSEADYLAALQMARAEAQEVE